MGMVMLRLVTILLALLTIVGFLAQSEWNLLRFPFMATYVMVGVNVLERLARSGRKQPAQGPARPRPVEEGESS